MAHKPISNRGSFFMNFKHFLLSIFLLTGSFISFSQAFPEKPNKLVNDYTNTLSADEISRLEQKLLAFDDSTSTQIAVVLIQSLDGYEIADYSARLFDKWGIGGSKKNNNGVLLLASLGDRKVWITTGYGVEGALPDAIAKRIIKNEIKPDFKAGNYYSGIDRATSAIISYTKGEYKSDTRKGGGGGSGFVFLIIAAVIILIIVFGKGGGGSQVIGSRGGASPFWWMLMGSQLGRGSSGDGGFGGFSGGGGEFGGFGGGSTGGGGAGGDW